MDASGESSSSLSSSNNNQDDNFPVQQQLMSNWCWAASTVAICAFYNDGNTPGQRQLVAQVTGKPIAEAGPLLPFFNDTADLGAVLQSSGHLDQSFDNVLDPETLQSYLQKNNPVGCQLYLPDLGAGHCVVITSCYNDAQGNLLLKVADPMDGSLLDVLYDDLVNNFRNNGGTWQRTYTTR
jgi:hypothetical protein